MKMSKSNLEKINSDIESSNKNHEAYIKNIKTQIDQLYKQLAVQLNGSFKGNKSDYPRNEICEAIKLRNRVVPIGLNSISEKKLTKDKKKSEIEIKVEDDWELVNE